MIYGQYGGKIEIVRRATPHDVRTLDGRQSPNLAEEVYRAQQYVVVRDDTGKERLYLPWNLKADGGYKEIDAAIQHVAERDTRF